MPRGSRTPSSVRSEILSLAQSDPPVRPADIAEEVGVGLNTVYRVLREADIAYKTLATERAHLSVEETSQMIEKYLSNGDVPSLLQEFAISQATFYRILRDNEIPTRQEVATEQKKRALDDAMEMYQQGIPLWKITQSTGVSTYTINRECHLRDIPLRRSRTANNPPIPAGINTVE